MKAQVSYQAIKVMMKYIKFENLWAIGTDRGINYAVSLLPLHLGTV